MNLKEYGQTLGFRDVATVAAVMAVISTVYLIVESRQGVDLTRIVEFSFDLLLSTAWLWLSLRKIETPNLREDSDTEFTVVDPYEGVWLTVNNISIRVVGYDDTLLVSLYAHGTEDDDDGELAATHVFYSEAEERIKQISAEAEAA